MHYPISGALLCAAFALGEGSRAAEAGGLRITDVDEPAFVVAKRQYMAVDATANDRVLAMRELVRRDSVAATELLALGLTDSDENVQRRAADWLAILGDERGLRFQAACVERIACPRRHQAIRHLGNWSKAEYAPVVAHLVRSTLEKGQRADGSWMGDANERAVLNYGTIALARMGRPEDRDLILRTVASNTLLIDLGLEALGYIDSPRSREILWAAYSERQRKASCSEAGLGVAALLPLSRLGEAVAIERVSAILQGNGTVPDFLPKGLNPSLCADRADAFRLRPRDAKNFAEVVLAVASQEPEGPGTMEAWEALGLMRPKALSERVFALATSRKEWKYVDRQTLFETVIAIDPSLGDKFWEALGLSEAPAEKGLKKWVERGVGYLMFSAGSEWTGD